MNVGQREGAAVLMYFNVLYCALLGIQTGTDDCDMGLCFLFSLLLALSLASL